MSVKHFVTQSGELHANAISDLSSDPQADVTVITALGAQGVGQSSFLNQLLDCNFPTISRPGTQATKGIDVFIYHGESSAVQAQPPRKLVVLDVEGFDGNDRSREEQRDRCANFAFTVADVIVFTVRMADIARVETNGVASLRVNLTEAFKSEDSGTVPRHSSKRIFIVVVKDYEADLLPREELINGFLQELQGVYEAVSKPARYPSRVSDLFEFEFVTLASAAHAESAYEDSVAYLQDQLKDPFSDDYLFEHGPRPRLKADTIESVVSKVWESLVEEQTRDMPPERELMATFECDNVLRKLFEKYKADLEDWERETEDGNVVSDFGRACSSLTESALSTFDQDAGAYRSSKAFSRKRAELKEKLDNDLYELFAAQTRKLREIALSLFRDKIDGLDSASPQFESEVNRAVKSSQRYFVENAELLRPRKSQWRFDNESKELASQMREDATDTLQRARLEDYAVRGRRGRRGRRGIRSERSSRQPITISFHYLDPAPFGWKDSRYEKLSVDDPFEYSSRSVGSGDAAGSRGLSVPLLPRKDEPWDRDFIYREK